MFCFLGFGNYSKPGPGVPKDAPPKPRIVIFFEIFARKFWSLVRLNLVYTLFNLPALLLGLFISLLFFQEVINIQPGASEFDKVYFDFVVRLMFVSILLSIPVITTGPAQAGLTYVLRNYSREEHAFIWSDFADQAVKNLKQSFIVSLIGVVVSATIGIALNFYLKSGESNVLYSIAASIILIAFTVFIIMHMYIYPMMVTFKLSIKQLYRNALSFSGIYFVRNLLLLILCVLILAVTFLIPPIGVILYLLITSSLIGLITNFYVYPKLKRHIMDRVEVEEEKTDIEL